MKPNRELLLQIKSGKNLYTQFYIDKDYDHSESIFSLIIETIDQLTKKMDKNASPKELHELLRKRFIKTGWNTFLENMEYVRPNDPENELHDSVNKSYYNEIAKAIGIEDFESYLKNPETTKNDILKIQKQSIAKLKVLSKYHDESTILQIEKAFHSCFKDIETKTHPNLDKINVIDRFEKLLNTISDVGVTDTEDREIIAEIIQDCLISYGFEDSNGILENYL